MRPRLLIVGPVPPPYHGCSVATEWLLRSPLCETFDLTHLDTSDRRSLDNLGRWDIGNVLAALKACSGAASMALRVRPDIVYVPISQNAAGFLRDGILILIVSTLSRAKAVVHLHGSAFREFHRTATAPIRWFIAAVLRRATYGIVLGDALRSQLDTWIPGDRIAAIPNGTSLLGIDWPTRESSGERVEIVFLGNLLKFKGVHDVVAVGAVLAARYQSVHFRFVGRWTADPVFGESAESIRSECLAAVGRAPRPDAFEFLGETDRSGVVGVLKTASIVVLPSRDEGLPLVLLEAMAAGLPVVSSAGVGAIPEVVEDGVTGILVRPGDRPQLLRALERLIEEPSLRVSMGAAGRRRCEQRFAETTWSDGLSHVFSSVMGESKTPKSAVPPILEQGQI